MDNTVTSTFDNVILATPQQFRLELSERKLLLRAGDFFAVFLGITLGLMTWAGRADLLLDLTLVRANGLWIAMIGAAWLIWISIVDLYDLRQAVQIRQVGIRVVTGGLIIGLLYALYFFVRAVPMSGASASITIPPLRLAPVIGVAISTLLLLLWRYIYARALGAPHLRRRVLIIGAGAAGGALASVLRDHTHMHCVGFVDDDSKKIGSRTEGFPVLGGRADLRRLVAQFGIDELVVAISAGVDGPLFQAIMDCHEQGVSVTPMPILYEQVTGRIAVDHIGSQWYVALPFAPRMTGTVVKLAKRFLDVLAGLVFGAVFLISIVPITVLIKLNSKGRVFYLQDRVGLHGKVFTVVKFRSMYSDAEKDGMARWATKGDDRITAVGRFLRKTRLDELPQVINVLKGEMSIVGPRPERQQFIDELQKQIPFYRTRLAAKPGLTGWAQVNYGYGATVEDALVKLQYDLYYLKHQSIWFDLNIILRTVAVVLKMKGQ